MTKQVHWLCSANYRLCLSLFWLEPKSFWFLPAFLVRWGPEPQQADGAMSQLFCLRGHERGYSKQFSVSPIGSLFGRDQELPSALCMNHPFAWYRTGTLHSCNWFYAGGDLLCSPTCPLEHCWITQLPGIPASHSGHMRPGDTLHIG